MVDNANKNDVRLRVYISQTLCRLCRFKTLSEVIKK